MSCCQIQNPVEKPGASRPILRPAPPMEKLSHRKHEVTPLEQNLITVDEIRETLRPSLQQIRGAASAARGFHNGYGVPVSPLGTAYLKQSCVLEARVSFLNS